MNKSEQDKIINICRKNDVFMIGIFGSTARGEATALSDIDQPFQGSTFIFFFRQ